MNNFFKRFYLFYTYLLLSLGTFQADHPTGDDVNRGLYEAMWKERRYAVDEIRVELELVCCNSVNLLSNNFLTYAVVLAICWISLCFTQAMARKTSALASGNCLQSDNFDFLQTSSTTRKNYVKKLEQVFCRYKT